MRSVHEVDGSYWTEPFVGFALEVSTSFPSTIIYKLMLGSEVETKFPRGKKGGRI
jgi:hypothetical protein